MTKKKVIIYDLLFCVFTLALILSSYFFIHNKSESDAVNNLNNYITLIDNLYDESDDAIKDIDDAYQNLTKYRITLISYKDGTVIYDNYPNYNAEENRLSEFVFHQDGEAYYKFSLTTNVDTLYVVRRCTKSLNFLRLGIAKKDIYFFSSVYLLIGGIVVTLLDGGFIYLIYRQYKKNQKFLFESNKLNSLANRNLTGEEADLNDIYNSLKAKIDSYDNKINENKNILDNMKQGFIVLDDKFNIISINEYCYKLFNLKKDNSLKNILYLTFGSLIEKELLDFKEDVKTFELQIDNGYFEFIASKSSFNDKELITLLVLDISKSKEVEKSKKEFFQNASHELKSPLTTIIGYEELIQKGIIKGDEDISSSNEVILKESLRMKNIVLDMLSLASLESNVEKIKENINLKDVILDIESTYSLRLKEKHLILHNDLNDFNIFFNKEDIYKLVNNIYVNAINYNKEKGSISISLKDNILSIKDEGIGISKEDQKHVFERFYRVDKARSKEANGTGLGLAIVKHICLNNKISISLNSELNKGSEFIFTFNN